MKKKLSLFLCIALLVSVLFSGCKGMTKGLDEAKGVMDSYFSAMKEKDYDAAMVLYSDLAFEKTDKSEWKDSLAAITEKLGDLQSYKLTGWNVNVEAGKGTYYELTYKVEYSDYDSTEVFTLYRANQKSSLLIAGQNLNSDGLLK